MGSVTARALYLLAKLPLPSIVAPKTLGVDDFDESKRTSDGTILVDLDQRRPIALLGDRCEGGRKAPSRS